MQQRAEISLSLVSFNSVILRIRWFKDNLDNKLTVKLFRPRYGICTKDIRIKGVRISKGEMHIFH